MSDVNCPICGEPQEINHDDGYGYGEGEDHEQQCLCEPLKRINARNGSIKMPNHITNKISLDIADLLKSEDREIDFNKIIPMPKSLTEPDPQHLESRAQSALGLLTNPDPDSKQSIISQLTDRMRLNRATEDLLKPLERDQVELLIQAIRNINEYGFAYWLPWANHNWGTKWGAYNPSRSDDFVTFETAWSHPEPVFLRLSELNPAMEIKVEYADEDTGSNCGTVVYKGGEIISKELAPKWDSMSKVEQDYWQRFALGITDPDNIEEVLSEYEEELNSN